MPIENSFGLFENFTSGSVTKVFLILFLIFYVVFSMTLFRQIQTMSKKLPTSLSPFLKFISVLSIGISLALLFLIIGTF